MLLSPSPIEVWKSGGLHVCVFPGCRTQFNDTCLCKEWARGLQRTLFEAAFVNLCWLQPMQNMAEWFIPTVMPGSQELCWYEYSVNKSWLPGVLCCQTLYELSVIKNRFFLIFFFPSLQCPYSFFWGFPRLATEQQSSDEFHRAKHLFILKSVIEQKWGSS